MIVNKLKFELLDKAGQMSLFMLQACACWTSGVINDLLAFTWREFTSEAGFLTIWPRTGLIDWNTELPRSLEIVYLSPLLGYLATAPVYVFSYCMPLALVYYYFSNQHQNIINIEPTYASVTVNAASVYTSVSVPVSLL